MWTHLADSSAWRRRLELIAQQDDNTFTYNELADMWDLSKATVYEKVSGFAEESNLITIDDTAKPHRITFHRTEPHQEVKEADEVEFDLPSFIREDTAENTWNRLAKTGSVDNNHQLEFERGHKWDAATQRGQLVVYITQGGFRKMRATALYDNGIIVSNVRLETARIVWE